MDGEKLKEEPASSLCPECKGFGESKEYEPCHHCGGRGYLEKGK
jgi:DnaJ-class molecular chaperone